MARVQTNPQTILARVLVRLVDPLLTTPTGFTADTAFLALNQHQPPPPNPGEFFCGICMSSGAFDQSAFDGAGANAPQVDSQLVLTLYNINVQDEIGHSASFLTSTVNGLYPLASKVFRVLSGHDLLDASGNEILTQPIFPGGWADPEQQSVIPGALPLSFNIQWNWDLTS